MLFNSVLGCIWPCRCNASLTARLLHARPAVVWDFDGWIMHAEMLTVSARCDTLAPLPRLLRKLEELCYKVTPVVVDAAVEHSSSLGNRRLVSRYESVSDFAHAVLGEMLNLDRAVVVSINSSCQQPNGGSAAGCGTSGVTAPNASQQRLHQRQQSIAAAAAAAAATAPTKGSKPSKGGNGSSGGRFNAAAAVAAAAAAGFTWTARGGVEASAPTPTVSGCFARMRQGRQAAAVAAAVAAFNSHNQQQLAAAAACQVSSTGQQQQQRPACTAHLTVGNVSGTSFCSAVTTAVTCNSTTFTTLTEVPSARLPSELLSPSRPSAPALPQNPSGQSSAPPSPLLAPSLEPTATGAAAQARHQLPTAAGGNSAALTEMLLAEQRHVRQARLGACGVSAPHSAAASRSTRSMSCMELSGGIGDTAREALLLDTAHLTGASATLSPTAAAATTLASSSFGWQHMRPAGCLAANCAAPASPSAAPSSKPSPIAQQQQFRPPRVQVQAPLLRAGEISPGGVSSRRSTDSDGSPFMLDGANTTGSGDLIAPRSFMMRGPTSSSTQHMFQRGQPLDPSTGRPPHGAVNLGSASAYSSLGRLGPSAAAHLAAALSLAAGSTSNRDAVAVANASGTNTGGSSPATGESSVCGLTVSTNVTCTTFHSSSHRFTSGQLTAQGSLGVCASSNLIACANASGATEAGGASRWSRDSAAAAAAMWGSEAADAFAAAMRFTTGYPYGAGAPCVPSGGRRASHSASASGYAKSALGGLYGIAESGSIPAGHGSDGGSSCEDCGVALAEMQSECVGVGYKGCQGSSNGGTCAGEVLSEGMPRVVHASLVAHAQ